MAEGIAIMIRIDQVWLSKEPLDMRAGPETCLARVIQVFGAAKPHHAYVFLNKRSNRMKVLVHDGFGLWLAAPPCVRIVVASFLVVLILQGAA